MKRSRLVVAVSILSLVAVIGLGVPVVSDLYQINTVVDEFRLDDAVHTEVINSTRPIDPEYVLDPPFMARYGLTTKDYIDERGYFAPSGNQWQKWGLKTKAAAVLMWRTAPSRPTAWEVRRTILLVDDYYRRNEPDVPVVHVVKSAETK